MKTYSCHSSIVEVSFLKRHFLRLHVSRCFLARLSFEIAALKETRGSPMEIQPSLWTLDKSDWIYCTVNFLRWDGKKHIIYGVWHCLNMSFIYYE